MGGGMKNVIYTSERVDVVHAHWAFKGTAYGCSNCGEGAITPMGKYCMECGAKMDLDEAGWPIVKGVAPDRVDVVRCGECEFWDSCGDSEDGDWDIGECKNTRTGTGVDDYCSYGKRRTEDDRH